MAAPRMIDRLRQVPGLLRLARYARYPWAREDAHHEWRRRLRGVPPLPASPLRRIVVICHGNICRSPFAEAVLARLDPELSVRSAGLEAGRGNPVEPGALRVARQHGVDLSSHRSQPLGHELVAWCDLILAMEGRHVAAVARRFPECAGRTRLLGDFLARGPYRIADPWGEGDEVFEETFARILRASEGLVARIRAAREGARRAGAP